MQKNSPETIRSICVYCGSSPGTNADFIDEATLLGESLAQHGIRLVYGGGDNGLMGAVARSTLQNGGTVLGVIPEFLKQKEQAKGTSGLEGMKIITVPDMHTRKQMMFEQADAFVALPGGIGTLEELVEIQTWAQLGRHHKPIALLNTDGFWSPYLDLLDHMKLAGFLHNPEQARPKVVERAEGLVSALQSAVHA